MKRSVSGFTIVELLIVIVVVAILAAITIVAYNGIQARTHDAVVTQDLSNIAKRMEIEKIDSLTSQYVYGTALNNLDIAVSKNSYLLDGQSYNLLNCTAAGTNYAILAISKSGKKYWISSTFGGVKEDTSSTAWDETSACPIVLPGSGANGAGWAAAGGWRW